METEMLERRPTIAERSPQNVTGDLFRETKATFIRKRYE